MVEQKRVGKLNTWTPNSSSKRILKKKKTRRKYGSRHGRKRVADSTNPCVGCGFPTGNNPPICGDCLERGI